MIIRLPRNVEIDVNNIPDDCPEIYSSCEYEVIGNIYDNPELMEE